MVFAHRESEIPAKIKRRSVRGARLPEVFVIEDYFSEPIIRDGGGQRRLGRDLSVGGSEA